MMLVIVSCTVIAFSSCGPCPDPIIEITASITGQAKATPSTVKNGDVIKLSIEGLISSSSSISINDKDYNPIVHYLIDGKEVAVSEDKSLPFSASYTVEGLSVGQHTLSVNITSSTKGAEFENKVSSSQITVIDSKQVKISLDYKGYVSKDLVEFVTPVLKYTDANGENAINITSSMWKEDTYPLSDTETYPTYEWENKMEVYVLPEKSYNLTFGYMTKEGAKADATKKYFVGNDFSISGYSYNYKGLHIGIFSNINIDIDISVGGASAGESKYLVDGTNIAEYVKKLCESSSTYKMLLSEDGKLTIEPVEKK